jgi:hypothetical protein
LTTHQFAIFLLQIAADIEHALLVQYLYAAYSLEKGLAVPGNTAGLTTTAWRKTIVTIATEEMGHLLSVQNLLRAIGGPLNIEREHFPFRSQLYPFPILLEPFTKNSLAKYVAAEMPVTVDPQVLPPDKKQEIWDRAMQDAGGMAVNQVGVLYEKIITVFKGLSDSDFRPDAVVWQADVGNWRANSRDDLIGVKVLPVDPSKLPPPPPPPPTPTVKEMALRALRIIADQGEGFPPNTPAPTPAPAGTPHFIRFLSIYNQFPDGFNPARPVPMNPNTTDPVAGGPVNAEAMLQEQQLRPGRITNATSRLWAHLFNVRYRILLTELLHWLMLPPNATDLRDRLQQWIFFEMHDRASSLRDLADKLATLPQRDSGDGVAGAPFEMPFSLALPDLGPDRWRLHLDLVDVSTSLIGQLDPAGTDPLLQDVKQFDESDDGSGSGRRKFIMDKKDSPV